MALESILIEMEPCIKVVGYLMLNKVEERLHIQMEISSQGNSKMTYNRGQPSGEIGNYRDVEKKANLMVQ